MKQEEDKWADYYRKRLEDYSEPVAGEIWDSLEKDLQVHSPKPRFAYLKPAVAAAILLLVTSSLSLLFLYSPQADYVSKLTETVHTPEASANPDTPLSGRQMKVLASTQRSEQQPAPAVNTPNEKIKEDTGITHAPAPAQTTTEESVQETTSPSPARVPGFIPEKEYLQTGNSYNRPEARGGKSKKWAVGVTLTNAPAAGKGLDGFGDSPQGKERETDPMSISELMTGEDPGGQSLAAQEAFRRIVQNTLYKNVQTEIKHKMPFTVGFSFRFPLSSRFSVETGLNYTRLSSELRAGTATNYYVKEQKLHYIGIPLKGSWMFLNSKYLSLYLSAGGTLEKSVAGSLKADYVTSGNETVHDSQTIKVKPLQWSVNSAVGIQYNATNHLGIFAEPGIVYYFDDGSPVETIRKEKPFNFNLQMGLRYTY